MSCESTTNHSITLYLSVNLHNFIEKNKQEFYGESVSNFSGSKNPYEIKSYGGDESGSTPYSSLVTTSQTQSQSNNQDFRTKLKKHDHPKPKQQLAQSSNNKFSQEQKDLNKEFDDFMTADNGEEIKIDGDMLGMNNPSPAKPQ